MKKLIVLVVVLGISAMAHVAQAVNENGHKVPFLVEFSKLSAYLQLSPSQMDEVYSINDYFREQQRASLSKDAKRQEERMQKVVYANLRLMKEALTADQYRKYLTLLNVTNNNNRLVGAMSLTDVYLADNK